MEKETDRSEKGGEKREMRRQKRQKRRKRERRERWMRNLIFLTCSLVFHLERNIHFALLFLKKNSFPI